jgi:hypothetical protein
MPVSGLPRSCPLFVRSYAWRRFFITRCADAHSSSEMIRKSGRSIVIGFVPATLIRLPPRREFFVWPYTTSPR